MAFTRQDYIQRWTARTTLELREKTLSAQLFDQSRAQEWVDGADKVTIPIPDWTPNDTPNPNEGSKAEASDALGTWREARRMNQNVVTLERSGGYGTSTEVPKRQITSLPWDAVERARSRDRYVLDHQIDTAIYDGLVGDAGLSTLAAGSSTEGEHFIASTFPYNAEIPDGRNHPALDAILMLSLKLVELNVKDGANTPTGTAGPGFIVFPHQVEASLFMHLLNKGYNYDKLTDEILRTNPGLATEGNFKGMLHGIRIFTWNHLSVPTGKAPWACYGGVRDAATFGVREPDGQFFAPSENQISTMPAWLFRQDGEFAFKVIQPELAYKVTIASV